MRHFIVLSTSLVLVLVFSAAAASEPPIFTGCPEVVRGSYCDSLFFQVVAVDPESGNACGDIRYHLVAGPGTVNELTGLWVYHPSKSNSSPSMTVEISASLGDTMTTGEENCRFLARPRNTPPRYVEGCNDTYYMPAPDTFSVQVRAVDPDPCDEIFYTLWEVEPQPDGWIAIDSSTGVVTFSPLLSDGGKLFRVRVAVPHERRWYMCSFGIETQWGQPSDSIVVRIEKIENQIQGQIAEVDITVEGSSLELGAFDLLLAYDTTALRLEDALPGPDFYDDGCGWEYFTYRTESNVPCDSNCLTGFVRLFGFADLQTPPHPACYTPDSLPAVLASLLFRVTNDRTWVCDSTPIRFVWSDCSDNSLTNLEGSELFVSRTVYNHDGTLVEPDTLFPTYSGIPPKCLDSTRFPVMPVVEYCNGSIEFMGDCNWDMTGDINVNGIPYEIADAMMFANFFVNGLSAFDGHVDGSVASSDATRDGVPLTVEDFVYLVRVVTGEANPYPSADTNQYTARFAVDNATSVVRVDTPDSLGAVQLVFWGEVTPHLIQTQMAMMFTIDSGITRVLVYSLEPGDFILHGRILWFVGDGDLQEVHTATYDGRKVTTEIDSPSGDTRISIETKNGEGYGVIQGTYVDVDITLEKGNMEMGGFDLLVAYDSAALILQSVEPGIEFYEGGCQWEYFTYRLNAPYDDCAATCPSGRLRILGIADDVGTGSRPVCNLPDSLPARLATMKFLVSNQRSWECQFLPIRFYWLDCGDNSLSNVAGTELHVSDGVYDFDGVLMPRDTLFPTYGGVPLFCSWVVYPFIDDIDYMNGGVQVICSDTLDDRRCSTGDLSGDGHRDFYDVYLYINLLLRGYDSLTVDTTCAGRAGDVNGDGIFFTLSDLVYLVRVVIGDADPFPDLEPSPNIALIRQDHASREVRIATIDSLGAVYLAFHGQVTPGAEPPGSDLVYLYDGEFTHVLVFTTLRGTQISVGKLFSYTGDGLLEKALAATYDGRLAYTVIDYITDVESETGGELPTEFSLSQNYPNPFNPVTTIEFSLPSASDVEIVVYNVTGQIVTTLVNHAMPAGYHAVEWNGTDYSGSSVASGIYLYRITAGDFVQSRKMMLLK